MKDLKEFAERKRAIEGFYIRIRRDLEENPLPLNQEIEIKGLSADFDGSGWRNVLSRNINEINKEFRRSPTKCIVLANIFMPENQIQNPFLLKDESGLEFGIVLL